MKRQFPSGAFSRALLVLCCFAVSRIDMPENEPEFAKIIAKAWRDHAV
jgi:hypothetical protein